MRAIDSARAVHSALALVTALASTQAVRAGGPVCNDDPAVKIPAKTVIQLKKPLLVKGYDGQAYVYKDSDRYCALFLKTADPRARRILPRSMEVSHTKKAKRSGSVWIYIKGDPVVDYIGCGPVISYLYLSPTIPMVRTDTAKFLDFSIPGLVDCDKPYDVRLLTNIPNPNAVATRAGEAKAYNSQDAKMLPVGSAAGDAQPLGSAQGKSAERAISAGS